MSHFTKFNTQMCNMPELLQALADLGYSNVDTFAHAQALRGYLGDMRRQNAEIIIRRQHISRVSNDIGFKRDANGFFQAIISDYDRQKHSNAWLDRLKQRYAYHVTKNTLIAKGFDIVEETKNDGQIRLKLRRMT